MGPQRLNAYICLFLFVQVFAWGCGSCLGCGSSETTSLRPRFIEDLSITKIIDISCGDSHCLALSHGKRLSTVNSQLFVYISLNV